jgi:hypothetical protein
VHIPSSSRSDFRRWLLSGESAGEYYQKSYATVMPTSQDIQQTEAWSF